MKFANRLDAATQLVQRVQEYISDKTEYRTHGMIAVMALSKAGVPAALEVAANLECRIGLIMSNKLPYPGLSEYTLGAVTSDGTIVLKSDIAMHGDIIDYIEEQKTLLVAHVKEVEDALYAEAEYHSRTLINKTVILVDDGIMDGIQALAAIKSARKRGATRVIVAAPVMSIDAYHLLLNYSNDVVCLYTSLPLVPVAEHYFEYPQVTDEEVVTAMKTSLSFEKNCAEPFHAATFNA